MGTNDPGELRKKAEYYRSLAMVGGDIQLLAALLLLAEEFDRTAAEGEDGARHGSAETPPPG